MSNRGKIILWSVVGLIALGVAGFFGMRSILRKQKIAPFKDQIATYVNAGETQKTKGLNVPPASPLKGKVIPVDVKEKEIDYVYFDLPEDMVAKTPEEVGTIILLNWDKEQVGQYNTGTPAYVQTCSVTVIDKASNTTVAAGSFRGSDPPQRKKSSESGMGSKPEKEVLNWLSNLRRS